LVSPANGSTLNTLVPTFVWEEIEIPTGMAITVEVSEYTDFSPTTTSMSLLGGNSVTVIQNLEPATKYFWRAFLYRWSDQTRFPYSETRTFTTPSDGVLPQAPTLISPAHESVIESSPIILESNQVPGAIEYQFWYKESGSFSTYVSISNTPQLTIPDYFTLTADADYVWWVQAKNNYGYGISSSTWAFTMSSDYTSDAAAKGEIKSNTFIYDEITNTFIQQ
jgi:hypothetical protein